MEGKKDVFTIIEDAKKNLDNLRKSLERDDTDEAIIISVIANTKSGEVDVTISGNTDRMIQLLTSLMDRDEVFKTIVEMAIIRSM